jgi:hypothetical protein
MKNRRTARTSVDSKNKVRRPCAIIKPYDIVNPIEPIHEIHKLRQLMDGLPNISGFNYRIARHKVGDDAYYRIHECFYDENGKVTHD